MKVDRLKFWKTITKPVRPLSQRQVNNINRILDYYDDHSDLSLKCLASILAQIGTESAFTYDVIREMGAKSYFKYLIGKLGIKTLEEAYRRRGWGHIQVTGYNFESVETMLEKIYNLPKEFSLISFINDPARDRSREFIYSLDAAFEGCEKGIFTGRKITDYLNENKTDWYGARRVVNPGQHDIWKRSPNSKHGRHLEQIVADSKAFYKALSFEQ